MSRFTANQLKVIREERGFSQSEAAKYMHISDRTLRAIEANERQVTSDEIIQFSRIYQVDVRELLLEEYVEQSEEHISIEIRMCVGSYWAGLTEIVLVYYYAHF